MMELRQSATLNGAFRVSIVSETKGELPKEDIEQLEIDLREALGKFIQSGWSCSQTRIVERITQGVYADLKQVSLLITPPASCCPSMASKLLRTAHFSTS